MGKGGGGGLIHTQSLYLRKEGRKDGFGRARPAPEIIVPVRKELVVNGTQLVLPTVEHCLHEGRTFGG